jgi:hypothetical protein
MLHLCTTRLANTDRRRTLPGRHSARAQRPAKVPAPNGSSCLPKPHTITRHFKRANTLDPIEPLPTHRRFLCYKSYIKMRILSTLARQRPRSKASVQALQESTVLKELGHSEDGPRMNTQMRSPSDITHPTRIIACSDSRDPCPSRRLNAGRARSAQQRCQRDRTVGGSDAIGSDRASG